MIRGSVLHVALLVLASACGGGIQAADDGGGAGDSSSDASGSGSSSGGSGPHGQASRTASSWSGGAESPDGGTGSNCDGGSTEKPIAIAAGFDQACALLSGGVECWGRNEFGQIGNGVTTTSLVPVAVPNLTGVTAIATGEATTCALLSNGAVECWGDNTDGELGLGTHTGPDTCDTIPCSTTPVVMTGLSPATAIGPHSWYGCFLLSGGTVECAGKNVSGQLGNGSLTGPDMCSDGACSATPVAVSGLEGVTAIAAGPASTHSCALLSGGTVECWGTNGFGELGNGSQGTNSATPVAVSSLTGALSITVGYRYTCAAMASGTATCWGNNEYGQLGNGTTGGDIGSPMPVPVSNLDHVTRIGAGVGHTCALISDGTVECWGLNLSGQLGNGTNTNSSIPTKVSNLSNVTGLAVGEYFNCALIADGTVECWGGGYLGNGTMNSSSTPVRVCL